MPVRLHLGVQYLANPNTYSIFSISPVVFQFWEGEKFNIIRTFRISFIRLASPLHTPPRHCEREMKVKACQALPSYFAPTRSRASRGAGRTTRPRPWPTGGPDGRETKISSSQASIKSEESWRRASLWFYPDEHNE
ncbi:hypothetical protein AMECASPLE_035095 [Ameca splendens]|uniref:Uncharacterized protein n=1 Tax=Ameca splendens TaxID=208324 RepID=A0ABV0ZGJ4_9TELE